MKFSVQNVCLCAVGALMLACGYGVAQDLKDLLDRRERERQRRTR